MEATKQEPKDMVINSPPSLFRRKKWTKLDKNLALVFLILHLLCVFAPFCFTWGRFFLAILLANLTGIGISVSYHRNLAHRSFKLPKWLEYSLAYCGAHALQGDPIDWVSTHRCHHRYVDSERDPHSPIYGFWFSQIAWLFDSYNLTKKVCPNYNTSQKIERSKFMSFMKHGYPDNVNDLLNQSFYKFMHRTYFLHPLALLVLLYAIGGAPFIIWGMSVRFVLSLHITSMVNSVCHIWGKQPWNTGDMSRNNWLVALLTFGEGWHNNHHAFEYSARHGHEWWQIDFGWYIIKLLQVIGLATHVKLPSENYKQRLAAD
ncbi:palmitoyl-monogalactosyldiacylglycerol delta-7 desaturase, chloroplastic-like [Cucurbita pepo subsp. pepo]|uniref:palmitoyl-monogalactosyldiacylglycerol delta-7 desaturase, chloroplastic-like n=1 Tax=Cucurbita pepo subsp. pepo TaxID=3664 RepID=UPI000C9D9D53|nr:palmitoyl-monogalactosyldiacylglycerol delta-7 desaturase, chloroplastic-like [Cucurbita pepo subsp. pepo]